MQVASGSFSTLVSDTGGGQHALVTEGSGLTGAQWRSLIYPWANTLVQCWNGTPVYAGLIVGWSLDRQSRVVTVQHKELRLLLNRRFPFRIGERRGKPHFTVRDKTLRGVITELVRVGVYKPDGGDGWNIPVALPASEAGTRGTTLFNYDFVTVENGLAEVEDRTGGPDVHFEPRFKADGRLEWECRIGDPRLTGSVYDYPMNVTTPELFDVNSTADGTEMLTGVFAIGKGAEEDMRIGEAGLAELVVRPPAIPYLDSSRSFKEIDDIGQLNDHGAAELRRYGTPIDQWEMKTRADGRPGADLLRLGSTLRLRFVDDWWEVTRDIDQYLMGLRGTHENVLTLDVQPLGG